MARTKIVCTIGPASRTPESLEQLIRAGMNVARLNFSHGTHAEHREVIATIRRVAAQLDRPVAILQDLAGPKIRIGDIEDGSVMLEPGALFTLTTRPVAGNQQQVSISYAGLPEDVQPGDTLLLSDGSLELEVVSTTEEEIQCRVIVGGLLSSRKGINLPARSIKAPSLTDKDRADLVFGIEQDVDYVALSFVRTAADVEQAKQFMRECGHMIPLIAKVEKHEALLNIDEIVQAADGLMVARGDLGVETPLEKVPRVQKRLIEKANRAGKPVITATQMLRSMVDSPRPTRAEVTDVANAILDGTDAVMLSEETAVGKYATEAVVVMRRIAEDIEAAFPFTNWMQRFDREGDPPLPEAVGYAACNLAERIRAAAIITFTQSGSTAQLVAKYRPGRVILAPTPLEKTYRRLALVWGVTPILSEEMRNTDEMIDKAFAAALKSGLVQPGQRVVITAGVPVGVSGTTNLIKAEVLKQTTVANDE
ncbi:MAG: pyruvate kinase [Acidobacteriota bacterium]|nr:pyruvate kinase [Blastocatellia bacterium]MDW8239167.1 pyruvate kinase [Acidobacteriota bacterium]